MLTDKSRRSLTRRQPVERSYYYKNMGQNEHERILVDNGGWCAKIAVPLIVDQEVPGSSPGGGTIRLTPQ